MKKGYITGREIVYVFRFIILGVILAIIVFLLSTYLNRSVRTNDLEKNLIFTRLMYSKDCIVYEDPLRLYPGIIDLERVNENSLSNCFDIKESNKIGFILNITDIDKNPIKNVKLNKKVADLSYLCNIKEIDFSCYSDTKYVLLKDFEGIKQGFIQINVVVSNE